MQKNPLSGTPRLLRDISNVGDIIFELQISPQIGVTSAQWTVLSKLVSAGSHGIVQVDIARVLGISKPALGKMIDRLENAGCVERFSDSTDGRAKRVRLTSKGRRIARKVDQVTMEMTKRILRGISGKKMQEARTVLLQMLGNMIDLEPSLAPFSEHMLSVHK